MLCRNVSYKSVSDTCHFQLSNITQPSFQVSLSVRHFLTLRLIVLHLQCHKQAGTFHREHLQHNTLKKRLIFRLSLQCQGVAKIYQEVAFLVGCQVVLVLGDFCPIIFCSLFMIESYIKCCVQFSLSSSSIQAWFVYQPSANISY